MTETEARVAGLNALLDRLATTRAALRGDVRGAGVKTPAELGAFTIVLDYYDRQIGLLNVQIVALAGEPCPACSGTGQVATSGPDEHGCVDTIGCSYCDEDGRVTPAEATRWHAAAGS